jgi:hypothetical protein
MSNEEEKLRQLLERYRDGQDEAGLTVSLLEGLHATLDSEGKNWLLRFLWLEVLADFQKVVKEQGPRHWIFPVAIPFWVNFGDTGFMTNGLIRMFDPDEAGIAEAWEAHISGQMCDALQRHYDRFDDLTIARIQAFAADVEFAAGTQLDDYRFAPELLRAFKRISEIIKNRQFEPVMQSLLAARNPGQATGILEGSPPPVPRTLARVTRDYSDPIPASTTTLR